MIVAVKHLLLLLPSNSYRNQDFLEAAKALGVKVTIVTDATNLPADSGSTVLCDFSDPVAASKTLAQKYHLVPVDAVVGVDDRSTAVAAATATQLGLRSNHPQAHELAQNKAKMRRTLAGSEIAQPRWSVIEDSLELTGALEDVGGFPVVVKPVALSQSRGVIRANDEEELLSAVHIARSISDECGGSHLPLLLEEYIEGSEYALEGVLEEGSLRLLAIFEKPNPLTGPFFEETIYLLPARIDAAVLRSAEVETERACRTLGIQFGPVHAEFRVTSQGRPYLIELAPRTVGGMCSRTLRFGAGKSLESLIISAALGVIDNSAARERGAAGVLMLPTASSGVLKAVHGLDEARSVRFIEEIDISAPLGSHLYAPPRSDRYLGFIFARGPGRNAVMDALGHASALLRVDIAPLTGSGVSR